MTRTILHTRFILITSSTAGFMALPSSAPQRTARLRLAAAPALSPPKEKPEPPPRRRMPGRPRPVPGGANACAGRDHAARQAEGRSARRGGRRAGRGAGAERRPPLARGRDGPARRRRRRRRCRRAGTRRAASRGRRRRGARGGAWPAPQRCAAAARPELGRCGLGGRAPALRLWRNVPCPCGARGSVNPKAFSRSALCKALLCGRLCRTVVLSQPVAVNIYNRCLSGGRNHPQSARCRLARQKGGGSGFRCVASVFPANPLIAQLHVEKKSPRVVRQQQAARSRMWGNTEQ